MTVAQLIEQLLKLPQHHYVVAYQRHVHDDTDPDDVSATGVEEARPLGHGAVVLVAE